MSKFIYFLFRRRTFFMLVMLIIAVLFAHSSKKTFWLGLPFCLVGEGIRLWSSGYLKKNAVLITSGPFAICRNPLYIGGLLMCIGYCIMSNNIAIFIAALVLFCIFQFGAVIYEEELLRNYFGESFDEYCKRVPRFLPHSFNRSGVGEFSWIQLKINGEHLAFVNMLIIISIFAFIAFVLKKSPVEWLLGR